MLTTLTLDIISRISIGKRYSEEKCGSNLHETVGEFTELLATFNVGDYIPWLGWINRINGLESRVNRVAKELDAYFDAVIEEGIFRRRSEAPETINADENQQNFVDVLLDIRHKIAAGLALQRDSLKATVLDMFAPGTDTTSTLLGCAMSELVKNENVMTKLEDEVRESSHTINIMGYDIPAGTQVLTNIFAIGRSDSLWENADDFQPEIFLDTSIDVKGQHFELLTFAYGRRSCPGIAFALVVAEGAFANLILRFDFALPDGANLEDLEVNEVPSSIVRRKNPLILEATFTYI
ncbi:OLC1v1008258C1 [Oldenlandia corymbosa var. corymbosa]|uniref:OLC1v1008258C1 n=1 Tax=Oldenlandia corymbosa var. corymbosa TaxID=529605 RepID=A0AAV1DL79_OLDCO|nr:OLC1v1008258C1 [Oldenlandia corymbosa var. corymbosa]